MLQLISTKICALTNRFDFIKPSWYLRNKSNCIYLILQLCSHLLSKYTVTVVALRVQKAYKIRKKSLDSGIQLKQLINTDPAKIMTSKFYRTFGLVHLQWSTESIQVHAT